MLALYLCGSAVLGGLNPHSDLDLLILLDGPLSSGEWEALTRELRILSAPPGCQGKRPLEVTVLDLEKIRPWPFPPELEYQYGEWLRDEAGQIPGRRLDPDLAILLSQARLHSQPLKGPEAAALIPPVQERFLHEAIRLTLPALIASSPGGERNALLTLARMWRTLERGDIVPKDDAAQWALSRVPRDLAPPLEQALNSYRGQSSVPWQELESPTEALVQFLKERIEERLNAPETMAAWTKVEHNTEQKRSGLSWQK